MRSLLFALVLLLICPFGYAATERPLHVFASILPIQFFVDQVGGVRVQSEAMVKPGHSPATFEPTPRQMARLAQTQLFVRIGVPFEEAWIGRIAAANPHLRIIDARKGIELLKTNPTQGDDHGHYDTHVWTDPLRAIAIADNIKAALITLDPDGDAVYSANFQRLKQALLELDQEISTALQPLQHRRFMVFHPAWGYYAARYGLEQIAVERLGKSPGSKALAALIALAKREGIHVILVQPQFNQADAKTIARAIHGRVVAVDPLAYDYFASLRRMTQALLSMDASP